MIEEISSPIAGWGFVYLQKEDIAVSSESFR